MIPKAIPRYWRSAAMATAILLLMGCTDHSGQSEVGSETVGSEQPNFLVVVADDLGYSDIGAFGGEIETPNLDGLARKGLRLTSFYTSAACSSTRAMLITGTDNHIAGFGSTAVVLPPQQGQPGYELSLNPEIPTIAERLRGQGYDTLMSGKWHLGKKPGSTPHTRGFSRSFALLDGGHNHFEAMRLSPLESSYRSNGEPADWPEGGYSTDIFTDRLLGFLRERAGSDRPFFAYLAYTAPHWPLQAPRKDIEKYMGRYDAGPRAIAGERLARQIELGVVPADVVPHDMDGLPDWSALSGKERALEARKMAVYAAMVDRLDRNLGRVLEELEKQGVRDNTYIIFLSDNGAEGLFGDYGDNWGFAAIQAMMKRAKVADEIDNSLDNLGAPDSWFAYGRGWAHVGEVPWRLFKTFSTEGGIRNSAVVAGPGVPAGEIIDSFLHVADIPATLVDLASGSGKGADRAEPGPNQIGHSWVPLLNGEATSVYGDDESIGWELFGGAALRRGEWKITYVPDFDLGRNPGHWGPGRWELFNLREDPGETTDLSDRYPDMRRKMIAAWADYARENQVVLLSPDTQAPAQEEEKP
jgi:arylsulfatase